MEDRVTDSTAHNASTTGPLHGLRVLEFGSLVAGPFAARIMAEFGAEVIKVEAPGTGDPLRTWRHVDERTGTSVWWPLQSRNKKLIMLNLKHPEGLALARRLAQKADVVIENFRPGTLENLGLGWEVLHELNPRLILTRVSGFGQTGPYSDRPGFGNIGESMGGIRYVTGYPDSPPVRVGISLGDSLAALYAVIGTLMAVNARDRLPGREGQVVDVALYEAVFSLMESTLPEYDVAGIVRERTGNTLPGIVPTNTYPTSDGSYIVIGGNSDLIFRRLMEVMGRPELALDPRYADNARRAKRAEEIDAMIGAWTAGHTLDDLLRVLAAAKIPSSPIYSIADIANDEQYNSRGMIRSDSVEGLGEVKMPGIVPKLSATPGNVEWYGGELGQHNRSVYRDLLGLSPEEIDRLAGEGVI